MATFRDTDQLKQLKDIFDRFDMDRDGSLTQLELAALLRSLGLRPTGDQVHILLAKMDANGNGFIEFEELVEAILPDITEQVLINQEQLMGQMAKMGQPLTYHELTEMMQEADTNGDGVISFNEFATVLARSAVDYLGLPVS
ncbi:probable calcium-binding protein CML15 [Sesamum indicum]|uniref:Probable calcium-binding protein CML15 n=1 Tax=Sesamum indicum TaxID=4182 RepID=A0A6I9TA27_SESIN|nr:probable calcium-binding protein CML15 [Sesamum indicum]